MIKYEVNKITKADVEQEVIDKLQYTPNTKEYDIEPNKIADALYTGRNYVLPKLDAESIIATGDTNLKQIKDLPKESTTGRFITKDTTQAIGKLTMLMARVAGTTNGLRKKDVTIERFKPIIQALFQNTIVNNIAYMPIGACYVSDKNPSELLRGTWELKAETKIGKIWERVA